jgi:kinesin family member 2/24
MEYDNGENSSGIPKISVVIRKRPLNKKEMGKNDTDIIEVRGNTVCVKEMK